MSDSQLIGYGREHQIDHLRRADLRHNHTLEKMGRRFEKAECGFS
jgi:hypothetical protein